MPPLVKGGQGRSSRSVRDSACGTLFTVLGLTALALHLIFRGCS